MFGEEFKSTQDGTMVRTPEFGDTISGGTIIAFTLEQTGSEGWRPNGIGMFYRGGYEPYVVWTVIFDETKREWFVEHGNYCDTITTATEWYNERGGK